jgi:hypothetical protein
MKQMKNLSKWAKCHRNMARSIIVICQLLLTALAIAVGVTSFLLDLRIPSWVMQLAATTFLVLCFFYPVKGQLTGLFKHSYRKQKSMDFMLASLSFLLVVGLTNDFSFAPMDNSISAQTVVEAQATFVVLKTKSDIQLNKNPREKMDLKASFKNLRRDLKTQIKALKKEHTPKDKRTGLIVAKIFLSLLALALALGLLYLVAALSCNLSCSGQEGAAAIVLILGLVGVLFLSFVAFKKIWFNKNKSKPATDSQDSNNKHTTS